MKKPYINSICCKFLNLRINSSKKWLRVYMYYALQYIVTGFFTNSVRDLKIRRRQRRRMRRLKYDIAFFQSSS